MLELIQVNCPCCGEGAGEVIGTLQQSLVKYGLDESWDTSVVKCGCGTVYQKIRPVDLNVLYTMDIKYKNKFCDSPESLAVAKVRLSRLLEYVSGQGKSLLDIGAGAGHFCREAAAEFATVYALECSSALCEHMEEMGGIKVLNRDVMSDPPVELGPFDTVTAYDVFEHVPDPAALLRVCHSLLEKDGMLVLCTQDPDYFDPLDDFNNYAEHFFGASRHAMKTMLEVGGFRLVGSHYDESPVRSPHRDSNYLITYFAVRS